ncbi:hypothetical protein OIE63_27570 [Streptomyces sp. NBC_01795]|uniref:Clp protease N-terminal domain-containing protein n=1 Tax=Streptomyces sp. NBC_01795 TaxID=2975943 RepID=UPI002DD96AC8|nr:Clp protease N-terminal domain-containing protein [Streptomyces sp. NBC_01795]WSA94905.1 hypothetical protein OIE63_27570 [Streptomyces sp. NBC_01795]
MFERFSKEARETVIHAQDEARSLGHRWIGTEHLLLAVLRRPDQPGAATLARIGVTAEACRAAVAGVVTGEDEPLGPQDAQALRALGIDLEEIRRRAEESFGQGALDAPLGDPGTNSRRTGRFGREDTTARSGAGKRGGTGKASGHVPFAARAKKVLELALRESAARKDRRIGVEHVVLGLLRSQDNISLAVLERLGVDPDDMRELVLNDLRDAA